MEPGGTCSPFNRRQFPRDSGCYDASLKSNRQTNKPPPSSSPLDESDTNNSSENQFCDNKNNLDAVVEQCNNEILARVRQAQKNSMNLKEELAYQPNIPNNSPETMKKPKDSYVSVHGQITLTDPCRKNLFNRTGRIKEDICEADQKLSQVKYVVGSTNELMNDTNALNILGRSCLSEKSSDSGVSSSSLSSGTNNLKDHHQQRHQQQPVLNKTIIDNPQQQQPSHAIYNVSNHCANRSSSTANK